MKESIDSLFKQLYSQEDSLSEHLIEIKLLNELNELKDMDLLKKYLKKLNDFNNSKNYKDVE
jgi:predicted transposase YdaD